SSGHLRIFRIRQLAVKRKVMANEKDRIPKEGDRVRTPNVKDEFVVVAVREHPDVVDLDLPHGDAENKKYPLDNAHLFGRRAARLNPCPLKANHGWSPGS